MARLGRSPAFTNLQSGRLALESVAGILWNHRPVSRGITGRNALESPAGMVWNTQLVMGMLTTVTPSIILLSPIFLPIIEKLGIDPVHCIGTGPYATCV